MMDQDCIWKYAEYSTFSVESDSFKYRLSVTGYSGDAGTYSFIFIEIKTKCGFVLLDIKIYNECVAKKLHVKLFNNTIIMTIYIYYNND